VAAIGAIGEIGANRARLAMDILCRFNFDVLNIILPQIQLRPTAPWRDSFIHAVLALLSWFKSPGPRKSRNIF
jgi:hypothetical protein